MAFPLVRMSAARVIWLVLALQCTVDAFHEDTRLVKDRHPVRRMPWSEKIRIIFIACAIVGGLCVGIYGIVLLMARREERRIKEHYKTVGAVDKRL